MSEPRVAVLVVEDEALVRMGIVDHLEEAGFAVFEAANADLAVALLAVTPQIRLLFTDIDMPGSMDGLKLAAAVRKRWPPVKIVVTSGHWRNAPGSLPEGSVFFAKPYDPDEIASTLRRLAA
ncbi:MAG: response regulator [Devosia sp.]